MITAGREQRRRDLVENLDQAHLTLDLINFNGDANVAEVTLSEVDYLRGAIAAAAAFIHELNEPKVEGRAAGVSRDEQIPCRSHQVYE